MNEVILNDAPEREARRAGWSEDTETRLPFWLTAAEAETLMMLCIGGPVPAEQEAVMMARINELLRAFLR